MRSLNRFEQALALLAMYVWWWIQLWQRLEGALLDYFSTIQENERGLRRGAADIDWQHTLSALAAPIRAQRLAGNTEELTVAEWREASTSDRLEMVEVTVVEPIPAPTPPPSLAATGVEDIAPLVAVTQQGVVVDTMPTPAPHKRNHRTFPERHPVRAKRPRLSAKVKRALVEPVGAPEILAAERRMRAQLDSVVANAMRALGLSDEEAQAINSLWSYAS
jgi:hypothetical protein